MFTGRADQLFSVLGWVLATSPVLQTPADFADALLRKLQSPRPHNGQLQVGVLDAARNWHHFLSHFRLSFAGFTGRHAAHAVRFVLRQGRDTGCHKRV